MNIFESSVTGYKNLVKSFCSQDFSIYKKYENYYKQGIVEYAFNGLLPEKQNNCRMSQNVV